MRFPNESDAYRAARDALLQEEIGLQQRLPLGGEAPTDYGFDGAGGTDWFPELAYR